MRSRKIIEYIQPMAIVIKTIDEEVTRLSISVIRSIYCLSFNVIPTSFFKICPGHNLSTNFNTEQKLKKNGKGGIFLFKLHVPLMRSTLSVPN